MTFFGRRLTWMSRFTPGVRPADELNSVTYKDFVTMAHRLLHTRPVASPWLTNLAPLLALIALGCVGCVLPLGYEADTGDGGVGAAPVIVDSNPAMPGPISITMGLIETYSVDVKFREVDETLYLRVFRDDFITDGVPRGSKEIPGGSVVRIVELPNTAWCGGTDPDSLHFFDVVVATEPFVGDVGPEARELPVTAEWSRMTWAGYCRAPM